MDYHEYNRSTILTLSIHTNVNVANVSEYQEYDGYDRAKKLLQQPDGIIAIIFGTISIILNVGILMCLYKVQNRITSHYRLIISLAVADILVGGSVLLYKINDAFHPVYIPGSGPWYPRLYSMCSFLFIRAINTTGLNITLLNLMTMAVDHYIAIMKPLQYPMIMTRVRVITGIVTMWVIALLLGFSDFFSGFVQYNLQETGGAGKNYCEIVQETHYHEEFTVFANALICLAVMIFIYTRIYRKVLHHRRPGVEMSSARRRETRRTSKALITTLLNIGTFILAWLPLCLFEVSLVIIVNTNRQYLTDQAVQSALWLANQHLFNLLIFNAIADPIIYTVRMREVRVGFFRLWGRCVPWCRHVPSSYMHSNASNHLIRKNSSSVGENSAVTVIRKNTSTVVQEHITLVRNSNVLVPSTAI